MALAQEELSSPAREAELKDQENRKAARLAWREIEDMRDRLATAAGRRQMRRVLDDGGFLLHSNDLTANLQDDHLRMAYCEAARMEAFRIIWPMFRMVAVGQIHPEQVAALLDPTEDQL